MRNKQEATKTFPFFFFICLKIKEEEISIADGSIGDQTNQYSVLNGFINVHPRGKEKKRKISVGSLCIFILQICG